jgi:hypothetical protein
MPPLLYCLADLQQTSIPARYFALYTHLWRVVRIGTMLVAARQLVCRQSATALDASLPGGLYEEGMF